MGLPTWPRSVWSSPFDPRLELRLNSLSLSLSLSIYLPIDLSTYEIHKRSPQPTTQQRIVSSAPVGKRSALRRLGAPPRTSRRRKQAGQMGREPPATRLGRCNAARAPIYPPSASLQRGAGAAGGNVATPPPTLCAYPPPALGEVERCGEGRHQLGIDVVRASPRKPVVVRWEAMTAVRETTATYRSGTNASRSATPASAPAAAPHPRRLR